MDRRHGLKMAACGLGLLFATSGCRGLGSRAERIPPEPPISPAAGPVQFNSDPRQAVSAASGPVAPNGPVARSPYSPSGAYGRNDPGGMAAAPANPTSPADSRLAPAGLGTDVATPPGN